MTIKTSGYLRFANINAEYGLGYDIANYRAQKWYWPTYSNIGAFSTSTLKISEFYGKLSKNIVNLTISADTQNYNVKTAVGGSYIAGFTTVNVTINSGIYVGSSSTSTFALTVNGFTTGDVVNIINNGYVVGAGGNGGNGGTDGGATTGTNGGNALSLSFTTNITNNGTIAGGGGGGGANNGGRTYGSCLGGGSAYTGAGGSGGAGYTPGSGGTGSPAGSSGTKTSGGGTGIAGGGLGQKGTSDNTSGGNGGYYIVGQSYANWLVNGTRLGSAA